MRRMSPDERRARIVDAALSVAMRKGFASTTVRDVAAEMGTSSGLVHHYFDSMGEVLASAFEAAAGQDLARCEEAVAAASDPVAKLAAFFDVYAIADQDWAFQLWLDAWAEAARTPALRETSQRLNIQWQRLLSSLIHRGVAEGTMTCADPDGAAWRILSLLDGLALQVVAHGRLLGRDQVTAWSASAAEHELGMPPGTLTMRLAGGGSVSR